jgi:hypothetical protein
MAFAAWVGSGFKTLEPQIIFIAILCFFFFFFFFLLKENFLLFLQRWCGRDMALVWSVSAELYCSAGA